MSSTPKIRQIPSFEVSGLTQEEMDEARVRAKRKLADEIAMAELGMGDSKITQKKGPIPMPGEEMRTLTIILEPTGASGDKLVVDGRIYQHGQTVTVTKRVYDSLREMMARGYQHQAEIDGKNSNEYRRKLNTDAISGMPQPDLPLTGKLANL